PRRARALTLGGASGIMLLSTRQRRSGQGGRGAFFRFCTPLPRRAPACSCPGKEQADMPRDVYESPFSTRYSSREIQHQFSEEHKLRTWRRLWVALAEAEQAEGLAITNGQIAELKAHINDVNYEDAMRREAQCRHDVMSHVYAYGLQCPGAKGIIHLGA